MLSLTYLALRAPDIIRTPNLLSPEFMLQLVVDILVTLMLFYIEMRYLRDNTNV